MRRGYAGLDATYLMHATLMRTPFTLFEPKHMPKAYANCRFAGAPRSLGDGAQITSAIGTGRDWESKEGMTSPMFRWAIRLMHVCRSCWHVNNVLAQKYYARVDEFNSYKAYSYPRNAMPTFRTKF